MERMGFDYLPASHVIIQLKDNIVINGKNMQVKNTKLNLAGSGTRIIPHTHGFIY